MSLLDPSRLPLPFCPGCGHSHLLPMLDEALERLDLQPGNVVLVSDIGCVGLADQFFLTSGLHGLHGRSFTYATGLKLARPQLRVIVLVGDGGCGIGGNHLLHAARRNVGICVLVFNNFNFGMTGGQHSATTPRGAVTATTADGNVEAPLDLCATVAPSRPAFVARTWTGDPQMPALLQEAIRTDGFALLDIWELCTAWYAPANRLSRRRMVETMRELGMAPGVVCRGERPEYAAALRARAVGGGAARPAIEPRFPPLLDRRVALLIAGRAGQRVQSTATIVGRAAVASGLYATQKGSYPITVRTGYSLAELLLGPEPIDFTSADVPDYAVVVAPEGVARARARLTAMPDAGLIVAGEGIELPATGATVRRLPAAAELPALRAAGPALVATGVLAQQAGLLAPEALRWAIRERYGERSGPLLEALAAVAGG